MRQGEDKEFANVLRKIGDYQQLTDGERRLIESRFVRRNNLHVPDSATRLFHYNKDVDKYNTDKLMTNPAEKILILEARDRLEENRNIVHSASAFQRRRAEARTEAILDRAKALSTPQACGLPFTLIAVVGYPYMCTRNVDTADGLVNGAVGELAWVEFGLLRQQHRAADGSDESDEQVAVRRLWMRFPGSTGRARSAAHQRELREAVAAAHLYEGRTWPYELPAPPSGQEMEGLVPFEREDLVLNNVITEPWRNVKRQQFPLVCALAMTIHKVQGTTKESILVLYKPTYSNPLVYVAITRVTKLSGLFIDDTDLTPDREGRLFQHPPRLEVNEGEKVTPREQRRRERLKANKQRFLDEKERLRSKRLVPRWQEILHAPAGQPRLVYHNVQGLAKHIDDIRADEVFMAAGLLLLAETHLKPCDQPSLAEGWRQAARCDWSGGVRRGGGVAIYSRLPCVDLPCPAHPDIEAAMVLVRSSLRLAVVYCHGKPAAATVVDFIRALATPAPPGVLTVVCGDFNVDMSHPAAGQGQQLMDGVAALGLPMMNNNREATTYCDLGAATVIDAVLSDAPEMSVARYQAYFSYHLPLVFPLP